MGASSGSSASLHPLRPHSPRTQTIVENGFGRRRLLPRPSAETRGSGNLTQALPGVSGKLWSIACSPGPPRVGRAGHRSLPPSAGATVGLGRAHARAHASVPLPPRLALRRVRGECWQEGGPKRQVNLLERAGGGGCGPERSCRESARCRSGDAGVRSRLGDPGGLAASLSRGA